MSTIFFVMTHCIHYYYFFLSNILFIICHTYFSSRKQGRRSRTQLLQDKNNDLLSQLENSSQQLKAVMEQVKFLQTQLEDVQSSDFKKALVITDLEAKLTYLSTEHENTQKVLKQCQQELCNTRELIDTAVRNQDITHNEEMSTLCLQIKEQEDPLAQTTVEHAAEIIALENVAKVAEQRCLDLVKAERMSQIKVVGFVVSKM